MESIKYGNGFLLVLLNFYIAGWLTLVGSHLNIGERSPCYAAHRDWVVWYQGRIHTSLIVPIEYQIPVEERTCYFGDNKVEDAYHVLF